MNICILISTYNGDIYIRKQLHSIFNQTVKDSIQLVIRDDGSTDGTIATILNAINDYTFIAPICI